MLMLLTIRNVRVGARKNDTGSENGRKRKKKRKKEEEKWKSGRKERMRKNEYTHCKNSIPVINGFSEMYSMEYVS